MTIAYAFALFVAATFSVWLATSVVRVNGAGSGRAPEARTFTWLLIFVAIWCSIAGLHAVAPALRAKILLSKFQYIGISGVPPLWLLFASEYAGASWADSRTLRRLLWAMPVATVAMAFTNEWHHAIWPAVSIAADGFAVYQHGWWFWIAAAYFYALALAGTIALIRTAQRSPLPFRSQFIALICAAVAPWLGNLLFLSGATHPGVDLTPLGFALACILCGSAFYRNHLFDLVPVARDTVVDSLDDAMIVIDHAGRVIDMNAAALRLITPGRTWIGTAAHVLLPILGERSCMSEEGQTTATTSTPDGDRFFEIRRLPLNARGGPGVGCVVLLHDATREHAATAEREAMQSRMHEQQRRESLSVLAGGLAHDFNNLLAGIVGNADLLSMRIPASSELGASVGAILLAAQRAADLVAKMLAYAGERHGSAALVDLDGLVREILDLLRASAARHCTIEYTGRPAVIDADPTQIRQVAMNLIINAADAVEEGGTVTVTTGTEQLSTVQLREMKFGDDAAPGEYAFLEVRDAGVGMTDETLRRIFHPFFTTKAQGHGLGLAAVQGIVLGHHGALRVDSSPGWGSRFCVWFPLAVRDGNPQPTPRPDTGILIV